MGQFFGFEGRIGRGGWWLAQLFGLMLIVLCVGAAALTAGSQSAGSGGPLFLLFITSYILMVVINICSSVKRYHDRGKSGWWFFVVFVPLIGGIWQLIELGFCSGDDGDNDYGPPPGSVSRRASLDREVGSLATSASGRLSKLDDDYLKNYARETAMKQAQQQMSTAGNFASGGSARPVFGKR